MVASISARGNAQAALAYYGHLRQDGYYTSGGEPPGRWTGCGAERLSLDGPVTQAEFEAALKGIDPKIGERLVQRGGQAHNHAAGWDMTFSAPKSVSVLWALSNEQDRQVIEEAQRAAVTQATDYLESTAAWARRGKGGAIREQTVGLFTAQFDHHTSRDLDPQLHTHSFVFNLAPRKDGTWGAIVSRELYRAQKQAGAVYRNELARELERVGHRLERQGDGFRVAAIPRHIERAFSKRRRAIEEAARTHGYETAKGMELAALRTRRGKRNAALGSLFESWQSEAKALGFELRNEKLHSHRPAQIRTPETTAQSPIAKPGQYHNVTHERSGSTASNPSTVGPVAAMVAQHLNQFLQVLKQPSASSSLKVKLNRNDREQERGR